VDGDTWLLDPAGRRRSAATAIGLVPVLGEEEMAERQRELQAAAVERQPQGLMDEAPEENPLLRYLNDTSAGDGREIP
jgi:hypothetical protein